MRTLFLSILSIAALGSVAAAQGPKCAEGFVWREAGTSDYVCVTPRGRAFAQEENAQSDSRRLSPGSRTDLACKTGFVWREAFDGDYVCVSPARRSAVSAENQNAAGRTLVADIPQLNLPNGIELRPAPSVPITVTPRLGGVELDPSDIRTRPLPEVVVTCNQMQIHMARRGYWSALYRGYGVAESAVDNHAEKMMDATEAICSEETSTPSYDRLISDIEQFRDDLDRRNAMLWGVPLEDALEERVRGLRDIDDYFELECMERAERATLPLKQFPLTPEFTGTEREITSPDAALGNCGSGLGGGSAGAGGPAGLPGEASIDALTLNGQAQRFQAFTSCMADFATQAEQCNSPVGNNGGNEITQEEAQKDLEITNNACSAAGSACEFEQDDDGNLSFHFTHTVDGETYEHDITFTIEGGQITDISETFVFSLPVEAAPPGVIPIPGIQFLWDNRRVRQDTPAPYPRPVRILPRPEPSTPQGGNRHCESFVGQGTQSVTFLDRSQQVSQGQSLPPMQPRNIMQFCRCQAGRAVGTDEDCAGPNEDQETRIFCMRAGGAAESERCHRAFREDLGPAVDLAAVCSSVIQCPPNSVMQGDIRQGAMACGCGVGGGAGGGPVDQCRNVTCPGPGATFSGAQENCCAPAVAREMTPRLETVLRMQNLRFDNFTAAVPKLVLENITLGPNVTPIPSGALERLETLPEFEFDRPIEQK
ncbi:MAG: hypothetical protein AAF583_13030 [Pseudomonadota bacterium]